MANLSSKLLVELNKAIKKYKLESVADKIIENSTECLSIIAIGKDDCLSVGNTRFGGEPDLPIKMEWPKAPKKRGQGNRFGNFIAQINFAELPPLAFELGMPKVGILYIFVLYMECAGDAVKISSVFYNGDFSNLKRRPTPIKSLTIEEILDQCKTPIKSLTIEEILDQCKSDDISNIFPEQDASIDAMCVDFLQDLIPQRIKVIPSISIASYLESFRNSIEMNTIEIKGDNGLARLRKLIGGFDSKNQIGQFLGYANSNVDESNLYQNVVAEKLGIRYDIVNSWNSIEEYEAAIKREKINKSNSVEYYKKMRNGVKLFLANKKKISKLELEWQLLFRLDSNFLMQFHVMDNDPFYVFIRKKDLLQSNFSNLSGEVTQG